jgi:hypothetical protein
VRTTHPRGDDQNGKVPLYVNLKEWIPDKPWTQTEPPTLGDLQAFVVRNLKRRLGAFGSDFIDNFLFMDISATVERHGSLLIRKIAVESVGLLRPEQIEPVIRSALSIGNSWISESAFNACRYIAQLSPPLETRLAYFLSEFGPRQFWARYSEIRFSLELSPGMKRLHSFWRARLIDLLMYYTAVLVAAALVDFAVLFAVIIHVGGRIVVRSRRAQFWSLTLFRAGMFIGCVISSVLLSWWNPGWPTCRLSTKAASSR